MIKLTEEDRQVIINTMKINNSKESVAKLCKDYDITRQYIYKLLRNDLKKNSENSIEQSIKNNESEFTKKANHIIDLIFARIERELENGEKINISQLSTTLGILYDKSRLENNLSTSNNSININIKVEK